MNKFVMYLAVIVFSSIFAFSVYTLLGTAEAIIITPIFATALWNLFTSYMRISK